MNEVNYPFGYCTNVHAGTTLEQAQANLLKFASAVRERVCPQGCLPVGLWLAEAAATKLIEDNQVAAFRDWLAEQRFLPYTFNGFPQGDFHQAVVKHAVYEPTWCCESRARYMLYLAEILDALLPAGGVGAISTLPLGWPHAPWHAENYKAAADNLLEVAKFLDRLAQASGKQVLVAIESEPGCVLNTAQEVIEFFEHYLFSGPDAKLARQYLSVCHDICHSGVMFESQAEVLESYRRAGIRVGKVQVSSAVHVPWDEHQGNLEQLAAAAEQLRGFEEPKYLHQTTRPAGNQGRAGQVAELQVDLPVALQHWLSDGSYPEKPWRVHFHVPIFVDRFGCLSTTQADIGQAFSYLQAQAAARVADEAWFTGLYEVETYAWTVLPAELAAADLSAGIAQELEYFHRIYAAH